MLRGRAESTQMQDDDYERKISRSVLPSQFQQATRPLKLPRNPNLRTTIFDDDEKEEEII